MAPGGAAAANSVDADPEADAAVAGGLTSRMVDPDTRDSEDVNEWVLVGPLLAAGVLMAVGGVLGVLWIRRRQKRDETEGGSPWGLLAKRKRSKASIEATPSQALGPSVRERVSAAVCKCIHITC